MEVTDGYWVTVDGIVIRIDMKAHSALESATESGDVDVTDIASAIKSVKNHLTKIDEWEEE